MYQDQQENLNNQNLQHQVLVYSYDRTEIFPVDQKFLEMNIEQVSKDIIQAKMGYSSRIHLYKEPVCSFNKIGFCSPTLKMSEIMKQLGVICFTYNNTQYAQEPDYHNHPQYSRPPSQDTIETVIQICQNNFFAHENYRVQNTTRIGFFNNACNRFGNNIHVQYFNTRLNIAQFANDSIISQTIEKFVDHMRRLSITVDSVPGMDIRISEVFQQISKNFKIQTKFYFKLCVFENQQKIKYFVISKKCEVKSLRYLLKIYYKSQPSLTYEDSKHQINQKYIQGQKIIIVKFSPEQKKVISLEIPIQNCQIIGSTGNIKNNNLEVIIIKLSCILYRISIDIQNYSCYPNIISYLPCISTAHLDEDLFFIRNEQLISYSITINMIKVKYYTRNGQLLKLKVFPWYKDLYEIQFSVVDMFCVKLKGDNKNKIRVFFIDDPQNYLQIGPCSNFYPAKIGNNVYSDGSGVFAITNHWYQRLQVYSLITKTKLIQFKLQKFKELSEVFFSWQQKQRQIDRRKVFLNFSNKQIVIYNMSNGQKIINVLCQKSMNNFFCVGLELACNIGSQLKIFKIQKEGNGYKFNWGQSIHIPDKCALVFGQNKILVRQKQLKFNIFSQFYIMPSK